jgi:hypothetical protein
MKKKYLLIKKVTAFTLSILLIPVIIISLFTFPIELIVFEPVNYYPVIQEQVYKEEFPQLVSDIISSQLFQSAGGNENEISKYQEKLSLALLNYLPTEWLEEIAVKVVDKSFDYFNFKTSSNSIEVNIQDLKNAIIINSSSIADEYLLSLEKCTASENEMFSGNESVDIISFAICKPSSGNLNMVSVALDGFIQDKTNQLPSKINVSGIIPEQMVAGEQYFYFYSIARWGFRLLPFLALVVLILVAQLLKNNKKLMRKWIGLMLTILPAALLLFLIILLIGFDQFIGLLVKQYFSNLIPGFSRILIWIMQSVGKRMILWVSGIAVIVALFGLILLLFARYTKTEAKVGSDVSALTSSKLNEVPKKELMPETMEVIEKREAQADSEEKV